MNVKRFLLAAGFALLCAGWAQASTVAPGHFTVELNDVEGVDGGGWGSNTLFTDTVNTVSSTRGFTSTVCVDPDYDNDCDRPRDPRMVVNNAGASIPFPSSFNSDEAGGGLFDFQNNSGSPITDILFITAFHDGQEYTCASDIFLFCGFKVVNMGGHQELEILFVHGSIASIPEPSEYLFLLIACAAVVVVYRLRSRRVPA
jgi:hypothetical protein